MNKKKFSLSQASLLLCVFSLLTSCAHRNVINSTNDSSSSAKSLIPNDEVKIVEFDLPKTKEFVSSGKYLKASYASYQGDSFTALNLFRELVHTYPKNIYLRKKYAMELVKVGMLEESQKTLEEIYKTIGTKDTTVALILAGIYMTVYEKEKARDIYQKIIDSRADESSEACVLLAKTYSYENKYAQGVKILDDCEKKLPTSELFSYYKGKLYYENNQISMAKSHFLKSYKINPLNEKVVRSLGDLYESEKKYVSAEELYTDYLNVNPGNLDLLKVLVKNLFIQSKLEKAIPYLKRIVQIDPEDLNLKIKLSFIYINNDKLEKAANLLSDILRYVPNSDKVLYYLGSVHQALNQVNKSIEYYSRVTPVSQYYKASVYNVAQLLLKDIGNEKNISDLGERERRFVDYVDQNKNFNQEPFLDLYILKATFFEGKNDLEQATNLLEKVRNLEDFNEHHRYYLASLYEKIKQYDKAYKIIEEILSSNPKNAHAWNFIGYSLLIRGIELDKSFKYITKAVELHPEDGFIRDSLGWYYYKTGKLKNALAEMKVAIRYVPDDEVIAKHLALIYQSLKKYKLARKYFNKALEFSKGQKEKSIVTEALNTLDKDERRPASIVNNLNE